jgi:hypothetical protein
VGEVGAVGAAIVAMLPFAIGKLIAVNPTIAVILLLTSAQGRGKALAYVTGALLGPFLAGTALLMLADAPGVPEARASRPAPFDGLVPLAAGLIFLALAYQTWRQRAAPTAEARASAAPWWMRLLDGVTTGRASGVGALMTVVGVKNLAMLLGAVLVIDEAGIGFVEGEIVLALFALIGGVVIAAPLVTAVALGPRADATLARWKGWLLRNTAAIMAALLLFMGGCFALVGIGALIDRPWTRRSGGAG